MAKGIRRIAVNTGGGDAPGLNAVIRGVVGSALNRGWQVLGISRGYEGLFDTSKIIQLTRESVRGITHRGGTILGTTNKGNPFEFPIRQADGSIVLVDRSDEIVTNFRRLGIDALIAIGGDGSLRIAQQFHAKGIPVVGVPKTIDNDLSGTVITFGFDTAVTVATDALDRLHSTAEAHERVFVVEVMGRYAGWIALNAGVSASCDAILIPEIPFDINVVCDKVREREADGRRFAIIVVAEGATPVGGALSTRGPQEAGREVRLGGIAEVVAAEIQEITGKETRAVVLGHLQRGGSPTSFDRLIALRFGAAAVRMVAEGRFGVMVSLAPPEVRAVPLTEVIGRNRNVPLDCDTVLTAREMGICFGDAPS
jgi:ATP-dependent phosphofructokinase / diphosphate-dependent phosphofructokinase